MEQFVLPLNRFDLGLLPEAARDTASPAFREAVDDYFHRRFREMGVNGVVQLMGDNLTVGWVAPDFDPVAAAIAVCQRGQVQDGVRLLVLARSQHPDSPDLLLNLGIGLNELGECERAVTILGDLLDLEPDHVRGLVALVRMTLPWTGSPGPSCSHQPTRGPSPTLAECCCGESTEAHSPDKQPVRDQGGHSCPTCWWRLPARLVLRSVFQSPKRMQINLYRFSIC